MRIMWRRPATESERQAFDGKDRVGADGKVQMGGEFLGLIGDTEKTCKLVIKGSNGKIAFVSPGEINE